MWLINAHNGYKDSYGNQIPKVDIEKYPAVKTHLDSYWKNIEKRYDQGDTPYNLRNCAYMEDFYKQKIVWKIIGSNINFFIDSDGYFYNNAANILTSETVSLESLIAFLNSNLLEWYFKRIVFIEVEGGGIQMFNTVMERIPIPIIDKEKQEVVAKLVREISLSDNNSNKSATDSSIDNFVYNTVGLSKEEIEFIESQWPR